MSATPTGVPIVDCAQCHRRHPVTREHCATCGLAHLFPCTPQPDEAPAPVLPGQTDLLDELGGAGMTPIRTDEPERCPDCGDPITRPGLMTRCASNHQGGKR